MGVLIERLPVRTAHCPHDALLEIGTGPHAGRSGRQTLRALAANPIVLRPILRTRSEFCRDRGRHVNHDAASFGGLRQRVRVEQIGPPWLTAERSYGLISGLGPRESDGGVASRDEPPHQATAEDAGRT